MKHPPTASAGDPLSGRGRRVAAVEAAPGLKGEAAHQNRCDGCGSRAVGGADFEEIR